MASTVGSIYRTLLRSISSRARVYGFVGVAVVQLVVAFLVRREADTEATLTLIDAMGLTLVIPLAALVFGTASLGDPIEDGTYVYLWLRPIRRSALTLAAFVATLTLVVPLAVVPTVVSAAISMPNADIVWGAALGSLGAACAYSAFFVLLGHLTRRALVWGIAYLLIFEQFIARGGRGVGFLSVHSYAASLIQSATGVEVDLAYFGGTNAAVVLAGITAVALGLSARRQHSMTVS